MKVKLAMSNSFFLLSFLVASAVALPWHEHVEKSNELSSSKQSYPQPAFMFSQRKGSTQQNSEDSLCKTIATEVINTPSISLPSTVVEVCRDSKFLVFIIWFLC